MSDAKETPESDSDDAPEEETTMSALEAINPDLEGLMCRCGGDCNHW